MAGNPTDAPASDCVYPSTKTMDVTVGSKTTGYSFDTTGKTIHDMGWTQKFFYFQATGASTTLTFTSTTPGNCGPALDNVTVTQVTSGGTHCKNGGWMDMSAYTDQLFKNQGDCVSYFATDGRNLGAGS